MTLNVVELKGSSVKLSIKTMLNDIRTEPLYNVFCGMRTSVFNQAVSFSES